MSLTFDPDDPRLTHGVDEQPVAQAEAYLVLSADERAQGFVRPLRSAYRHVGPPVGPLGCGAVTHMGAAIAKTFARDPRFYGATYCCGCAMHRPVGEFGEFIWLDPDGTGAVRVGT